MKDNPRKAELREALGKAKTLSGAIPGILQGASSAMTAKAWTGGSSGAFLSGLTEHSTSAVKGGTASVDEVQHAYDTCPDQVTDTSTTGPS